MPNPDIGKYATGSDEPTTDLIFTNMMNDVFPVISTTVKPVCYDHLYDKICYLWFIQRCVLMKDEGTN